MKNSCLALFALAIGASAQQPAPDCVRPETLLSTNPVNTGPTINVWMRVISPHQSVAGGGPGQVHTAKVAYAFWWDTSPGGDYELAFDRSTDGGWSWGGTRRTIFTNSAANGEWSRLEFFEVAAWENSVFVVFLSSRLHPNGSSAAEAVIAYGSSDQGQTWQGPLLLSTGVNGLANGTTLIDCGPPRTVASTGILHTAFAASYADDGTGSPSTFQDVYYIRAGINGGVFGRLDAEEIRLDAAKGAPGTIDSDDPDVGVDANVVCVAWEDDRILAAVQTPYVGDNYWNNFYCKSSQVFGGDLGAVAEVGLTSRTNGLAVFTNQPQVGVSGNNIYVLVEDGRMTNAYAHDAFLNVSRDAGATWQPAALVNRGPRLAPNGTVNEVDVGRMAVDGNTVVIPYLDSRNGSNNNPNTLYVVTSRNAAADIQAGSHVEHRLTPPNLSNLHTDIFNTDVRGDVIAVAFEPRNPSSGEDAMIGYSCDGGRSWGRCYMEFGAADCDGPTVAITGNGDIVGIFHDDRFGGGNARNYVFTTGLKAPWLEDLTGSGLGMVLRCDAPNAAVFVFPSLVAPASGAFPLEPLRGIDLNFVPDSLTIAAVGAFTPFVGFTDAQGVAVLAWPNFARLLGIDLYYAGGVWDFGSSQWVRFTDPILQPR